MPGCVPAEFRVKPSSSILIDADGHGNVPADTVRGREMAVQVDGCKSQLCISAWLGITGRCAGREAPVRHIMSGPLCRLAA
jgi:hypothetical protein